MTSPSSLHCKGDWGSSRPDWNLQRPWQQTTRHRTDRPWDVHQLWYHLSHLYVGMLSYTTISMSLCHLSFDIMLPYGQDDMISVLILTTEISINKGIIYVIFTLSCVECYKLILHFIGRKMLHDLQWHWLPGDILWWKHSLAKGQKRDHEKKMTMSCSCGKFSWQ